jgi:hypothetical protein
LKPCAISLTLLSCSFFCTDSDFCYDPDAEKSENHESGGSSGAAKTLDSRGSEYCDNNKCGECMGDCDSVRRLALFLLVFLIVNKYVLTSLMSQDEQCELGLVCFQRGPNESVPECIGQDRMGKFLLSHQCFLHSVLPFIFLTFRLHFTNLRH